MGGRLPLRVCSQCETLVAKWASTLTMYSSARKQQRLCDIGLGDESPRSRVSPDPICGMNLDEMENC